MINVITINESRPRRKASIAPKPIPNPIASLQLDFRIFFVKANPRVVPPSEIPVSKPINNHKMGSAKKLGRIARTLSTIAGVGREAMDFSTMPTIQAKPPHKKNLRGVPLSHFQKKTDTKVTAIIPVPDKRNKGFIFILTFLFYRITQSGQGSC